MKTMLEVGIKVRYTGDGISYKELNERCLYTVTKSAIEKSKRWGGNDNMVQLKEVEGSFDADAFMEQYEGQDRFEVSSGCECLGWYDRKPKGGLNGGSKSTLCVESKDTFV